MARRSCCCCTRSDNFDRADAAPGIAWNISSGTWQIHSNGLRLTGAGTIKYVPLVALPNYASVDVAVTADGDIARLYMDHGRYIVEAKFDTSGYTGYFSILDSGGGVLATAGNVKQGVLSPPFRTRLQACFFTDPHGTKKIYAGGFACVYKAKNPLSGLDADLPELIELETPATWTNPGDVWLGGSGVSATFDNFVVGNIGPKCGQCTWRKGGCALGYAGNTGYPDRVQVTCSITSCNPECPCSGMTTTKTLILPLNFHAPCLWTICPPEGGLFPQDGLDCDGVTPCGGFFGCASFSVTYDYTTGDYTAQLTSDGALGAIFNWHKSYHVAPAGTPLVDAPPFPGDSGTGFDGPLTLPSDCTVDCSGPRSAWECSGNATITPL